MSNKGTAVFPTGSVGRDTQKDDEKSRRKPAAFGIFDGSNAGLLEGWLTAVPALTAKTAVATGEDRKPALLGVVERLVEWVSGIRDLLHSRGAGRHGLGALAQMRHRIVILLLILLLLILLLLILL